MSDDEIIVLQHARLMWLYMLTSIAVINTGLENIAMFSNISKISWYFWTYHDIFDIFDIYPFVCLSYILLSDMLISYACVNEINVQNISLYAC